MSKIKKILSLFVLVFALAFVVACDKKPEKGDTVEVTVIVESQTEELSNKTHQIEEFSSVFELLNAYYSISFTRSEMGPYLNFITIGSQKIGDKENTYVAFYVNGDYATKGIGDTYVKADDIFKFVETKF